MPDYRIRFVKGNELKYLSHLELIRAIERALRRGNLPLAFSEGFHPHAKLSFGPALAVGISSQDEYFDLQLTEDWNQEKVVSVLNSTLPRGIAVVEGRKCSQKVKPLNAIINRAAYLVELFVPAEDRNLVIEELTSIVNRKEVIVTRTNKNGQKQVNIRQLLHNLKIEIISEDIIQLELIVKIGNDGNFRPEEIVNLLPRTVEIINLIRTGLWYEEQEQIIRPLDLC